MSNSMDPGGLRKLERALASLPFMQREIFLAHARDGLSGVEIASLVGLGERRQAGSPAALCTIIGSP